MRQDFNNSSKKSEGNVQDDGVITVATLMHLLSNPRQRSLTRRFP